jgi:hypothetical protein
VAIVVAMPATVVAITVAMIAITVALARIPVPGIRTVIVDAVANRHHAGAKR